MNNSRNPHPQSSATNFQLLRGLFEITFTWPLLWMLRVTYFGNEPLFLMTQRHFYKVPTTQLALLLQKVAVKYPMDIPRCVLSFLGYSTCKVQYIQQDQGGKVKLWLWRIVLPIFAEAAEKVSASSCSSSFSARGYKACNSSGRNEHVPAPGKAVDGLPFLARTI